MHYYIGLMSGTSMDAIDAALLDFSNDQCRLIASHSHTIPTTVKQQLQQLIRSQTINLRDFGTLDVSLGQAFAAAAKQLLQQHGINAAEVRAIGSHGQTVYHAPDNTPPFSIQLGDPNSIAQLTGITTVADFRRRDIAAGGQGAPLVPAFHHHVFRSQEKNRVILNIGGISNITILAANSDAPILGFDTGPGNCLLDGWINQQRQQAFDKDGVWGTSGNVSQALLDHLLADDYFSSPPPKSTGLEYFNLRWLQQHDLNETAENIQATLAQLTVESIALALEAHAPETEEVYVCGGGTFNPLLMHGLGRRLSNIKIATTASLGVNPEWVEAAAFAWLAKQTLAHKPGNIPDVTGASAAVILGGIYPVS